MAIKNFLPNQPSQKLILTLVTPMRHQVNIRKWCCVSGLLPNQFLTKIIWSKLHLGLADRLPIEYGVTVQDYHSYRSLVDFTIQEIVDGYNQYNDPIGEYAKSEGAQWISFFPIEWIWFADLKTVVIYSEA